MTRRLQAAGTCGIQQRFHPLVSVAGFAVWHRQQPISSHIQCRVELRSLLFSLFLLFLFFILCLGS